MMGAWPVEHPMGSREYTPVHDLRPIPINWMAGYSFLDLHSMMVTEGGLPAKCVCFTIVELDQPYGLLG